MYRVSSISGLYVWYVMWCVHCVIIYCQPWWSNNYPPFASRAKGKVFVLLYVFLFFCSVNDFSTTRRPIHAKVRIQAYNGSGCVFPLLGVGGPRRAEKGANEIFVTMGVNGEFLHFGGFWAISQQRLHGSTPNIICVGTMSADVPPPPVWSIGPWGRGEGELKT